MDVTGLLAVLLFLGTPAYIVKKVAEYRLRRRELELHAERGGDERALAAMHDERRLLVERIENLETIVCGVDHDLNQKLVKLIDEQRLLASSAGASAPAAAAAAPAAAPA